jgi:hypothetical protein
MRGQEEYYYVVADKIVTNKSGEKKVKRIVAGPVPYAIGQERVDGATGRKDIVKISLEPYPSPVLAKASQYFKDQRWSETGDIDQAMERMGHKL